MIVQCPSCSKRYRVNDANIPPSGGKIRCPECSHAFVVYPEAPANPAGYDDPGEKTSVAQAPNMQELLRGMQQGGGGAAPEEEAAKTEVMSGAELPDFGSLFGGAGESPDQTTEMQNPLAPGGVLSAEDDLATQELTGDKVRESLDHLRNQANNAPPLGGGDDDATQIAAPPNLDNLPSPGAGGAPPSPSPSADPAPPQRRASAPTGPTPPPTSGPQGMGSTPNQPPPSSEAAMPGSGAASPPPAGGSDGPDASHEGPWKLKTNFGLTYEFADNDSLRNWLSSRDELDGYELSGDGENFYPLDQFPQVQSNGAGRSGANPQTASSGRQAPMPGGLGATGSGPVNSPSQGGPSSGPMGSGPMGSGPLRNPSSPGGQAAPPRTTSTPGSGGSPFMTAASPAVGGNGPQPGQQGAVDDGKEKINPNEQFKPPSRDSAALNVVLWGAFGILVVAALVLALQLIGVIDIGVMEFLGADDDGEEVAVVEEVEEPQEVAEEPEEEEADDGDDLYFERVNQLLESAEQDIDSNRLSSALDRLDSAAGLDPDRPRIYELKAQVHETLGEEEVAEELRERAEELRQAAGDGDSPPAPEEELD